MNFPTLSRSWLVNKVSIQFTFLFLQLLLDEFFILNLNINEMAKDFMEEKERPIGNHKKNFPHAEQWFSLGGLKVFFSEGFFVLLLTFLFMDDTTQIKKGDFFSILEQSQSLNLSVKMKS